ncbi:MAG: FMN-binding protein [Crocinitomicaceae bacterium]|nr:FMN-binding protein [Crocinitomicaceae bacterium]
MKTTIKIAAIFSVIAILFAFANPDKKINKLVSKVWKNQETTLTYVDLPDSVRGDIAQLNEVWLDDKLVGYACYTTAFGCNLGGCAAPSTPTSSYETFDYIVIYDANLSILKVDIADYGGQYGYEICRAGWLSQFKGQTSGFKLNDNIDGISGATVSASYLIDDLNGIGQTLKELQMTDIL